MHDVDARLVLQAGDYVLPAPGALWADRAAEPACSATGTVDLYWIPLGAGGHSVRVNGVVYEFVTAAVARRARRDIYHSALIVTNANGRYSIEMTPVPKSGGEDRGVVGEGSVGAKPLGWMRLFRYEVRCSLGGSIPDLGQAVGGPVRLSRDRDVAGELLAALHQVPRPTWGRDELHLGEMWTCNSMISWALASVGIDVSAIAMPVNGRAPGWDAGVVLATSGTRHQKH